VLFRIDPSSAQPLFAQVAAAVRAEVVAGRLQVGDRLPPARDVAESLGINVHTVLHAYQDLRDEGLIELRRGRGTTVTSTAAPLAALHDDLERLVARAQSLGLSPETLAAMIKEIS